MNIIDILWIGPHNIEIVEVCILQCNAFFFVLKIKLTQKIDFFLFLTICIKQTKNQTQLLTHFESEDIMDQEFHREALKGLMMLCEAPLNPDAKEWKPRRQPRTLHHLRGKT